MRFTLFLFSPLHVEAAYYGVEVVASRYFLGALNQLQTRNTLSQAQLKRQTALFKLLRMEYMKPNPNLFLIKSLLFGTPIKETNFESLDAVNCGEMAFFAKKSIHHKYPTVRVENVSLEGGEHAMLVVGRFESSDPKDIKTWGEDAVICDSWASEVYFSCAFELQRKHGKKFVFCQDVFHANPCLLDNYLAGKPTIVEDSIATLIGKK